ADRETVDPHDRLRVPPEEPRYTLRRVWLTKEEEEGYYYGFANEGLWPLCHIAHTRPIFRLSDWEHYQKANRKFAEAVLEEMDGTLEARIDLEHFTVNREDHRTLLKPFPISVEFPDPPVATTERESTYVERGTLLRELGVEALFLGVGVDRVDYTKGILERFL